MPDNCQNYQGSIHPCLSVARAKTKREWAERIMRRIDERFGKS